MSHRLSPADQAFAEQFEACAIAPDQFNHRAHLRLAYVYLCADGVDAAATRMKDSLLAYLAHLQVDPAKFHETMTRAWVMAVQHFLLKTPTFADFDAFIDANPVLMDTKIMLTHYSAETLFSAQARARFVAPDRQSIPPP